MTGLALPPGLTTRAMKRQVNLHQKRIETLYNRHRALFAESLVAELLPGADESQDPSAAWDVTWAQDGSPIRIQVKCSGGYLPRNVDKERVAPAAWSITEPAKGWDPDGDESSLWNLGPGHHCDVFVLARHVGRELGAGWSFAAVPTPVIAGAETRKGSPRTRFTDTVLAGLGAHLVSPVELANAVRAAVTVSRGA